MAPPPTHERPKFVVADWRPYWSIPPPWNAFAVYPYGARISSTNPRACSAREIPFTKPV